MTIVINGTTGISGVDGSAGTPAVQGTDTNTGVFYPAADTVGVSTGGSERMRVDSSGNVGIGTTNTTDQRLKVKQSADTGASSFSFKVEANANDTGLYIGYRGAGAATAADTCAITATYGSTGAFKPMTFLTSDAERMRIDSSGNVGIGQSSITQAFGGYTQLNISGSNGATIQMQSGATSRANLVADGNALYIAGLSGSIAFGVNGTGTGTEVGRFTSTGLFQFNSGYGSVATAYGCRAWVNFNGTGTVAIRASGNVTSITDNGVGDYTVNFTNAMPDANYSSNYSIGELNTNYWGPIPYIYAQTTTSCRVRSVFATGSFYDQNSCNFSVFR